MGHLGRVGGLHHLLTYCSGQLELQMDSNRRVGGGGGVVY